MAVDGSDQPPWLAEAIRKDAQNKGITVFRIFGTLLRTPSAFIQFVAAILFSPISFILFFLLYVLILLWSPFALIGILLRDDREGLDELKRELDALKEFDDWLSGRKNRIMEIVKWWRGKNQR